jgi:hypothetical protein
MSRSSPDPGDYRWCVAVLGEALADALWPHLGLAEANRLIRRHGYPRDNEIPPPLRARLLEADFQRDALESLRDELPEGPQRLTQEQALETLCEAARRATS